MRLADGQPSTAPNARWKHYAKAAGLGLFLLFGGLVYVVVFVRFHVLDATPEMRAHWAFHARIGFMIQNSGLAVVALACAGGVLDAAWSLVMMVRRNIPRNHPD